MRSASLLLTLLLVLPACPDDREEAPEEVVEGFLSDLNGGRVEDWDAIVARLSTDAKALMPTDEGARIVFKNKVLNDFKGRIRYEVEPSNQGEGGTARVPVTLTVTFSAGRLVGPITRRVTFGLVREDDAWKLLPAVTMPSGVVIENPLVILTLTGWDGLIPKKAPGSDRPGAGD